MRDALSSPPAAPEPPEAPQPASGRRARTLAGRIARFVASGFAHSLGTALVFASATVASVKVHQNTRAMRGAAQWIANRATAELFLGTLNVGGVETLELGPISHVRVRDASVLDPEGATVLAARGIDVHIELARLLTSVLRGGTPDVELPSVRIDEGEVALDASVDAKGARQLGIPRAFTPRPEPPSRIPRLPTPAKKGAVRLRIDRASIGHAAVHGDVVPPWLDGDVRDVRASMRIVDDVYGLDVEGGELATRRPWTPIQGRVRGALTVPLGEGALHLETHLDGDASGTPLTAEATLEGDTLDAKVIVPEVTPEGLARAFPAATFLRKNASVTATAKGTLPTLTLGATAKADASTVVVRGELDLTQGLPFRADVDVDALDTGVVATVPSKLSGTIHTEGALGLGVPVGSFRVVTRRGVLAGQEVPPLDVDGRFEEKQITAVWRGREQGLDASGKLVFDVPKRTLTFDLQARTDLGTQTRFPQRITGLASGRARGTVDLARQTIRGDANLNGERIATAIGKEGHVRVAETTTEATFSGPLAAPTATVKVRARGVSVNTDGKEALEYPFAEGSTRVALGDGVRLLDPRLEVAVRELRPEPPPRPGGGGSDRPPPRPTSRPDDPHRPPLEDRPPDPGRRPPPGHDPSRPRPGGWPGRPPPGDDRIAVSAGEIRLSGGRTFVSGAKVRGVGAPMEVEIGTGGGVLRLRVKSDDVDMHRLAAATGVQQLEGLPEDTRASLDVDVTASMTRADGRFDVRLESTSTAVVAELHGQVAERRAALQAKVTAGAIGWVEIPRAEIELPSRLDAASLLRATGSADLRGHVDLSQGAAFLAGDRFERVEGGLALTGIVSRGNGDALPSLRLTARTEGLDMTTAGEARDGGHRLLGVDGSVTLAHDGATDLTDVALHTWDAEGTLASAQAITTVPLLRVLTGQQSLSRADVANLVASAVVDVPARELETLPGWLSEAVGLTGLRADEGRVAAHGSLLGPLRKPTASAALAFEGLRMNTTARNARRASSLSGGVDAQWDGQRVIASVHLDEERVARKAGKKKKVAEGEAPSEETKNDAASTPGQVRGLVIGRLHAWDILRDLARDDAGDLPWNASAELDVRNLELGMLPLPMNVRGALTGRFRLRNLNGEMVGPPGSRPPAPRPHLAQGAKRDRPDAVRAPLAGAARGIEGRPSEPSSLDVDATVADLTVSNVKVEHLDMKVVAGDGSLLGGINLRQDDGGAASLQIASRSLTWKGLDVGWDDELPTRIDYNARALRLALLRPLVRKFAPEIDGTVDGRGNVSVDRHEQVFDGGLALSKGRLYLNVMGEELTDVSARAQFEKSGVFRITEARGKLGAGAFQASASGRMNGVRFEGLDAVIVIPSKEGIPLSSEGATFAQAAGEVKVSARMSDDRKDLLLGVEVPRSEVEIPVRSTQTLQSLDADPTVLIGVRDETGALKETRRRNRRGAGDTTVKESQGKTRVTMTLGDDVSLQGRGVRIGVTGKTVIDIADEVAVTGRLDLKNGTVDVQGRRFTVDHGTVTFPEGSEIDDPQIVAAAYWDAPDRTRVWVEFTGPLKTGSLILRSEPAYSENEILSLLLFGRPDPNMATAGERTNDATKAAAVGAGFASAGLNQALGELSDDIDLEQDQTSHNRLRTKVGYRVRRNLKVQVGYAAGFSQREPDSAYLFVDWQFIPQWSVIGTRGDKGTSIVDVLFQRRY